MNKNFDETGDETGDIDLVIKDVRFTYDVQKHIEKSVPEGVKPQAAAREVDISKSRFEAWYKNIPHFKEWIDKLWEKHMSDRRREVIKKIDEVDDAAKAAKLNMDYLERVDKEFGTKHQHVTTDDGQTVDPDAGTDADDFIKGYRLDRAEEKDADESDTAWTDKF